MTTTNTATACTPDADLDALLASICVEPTEADLHTALTGWRSFFLGEPVTPCAADLDVLTALALQSQDPALHALADLVTLLATAYDNGMNSADTPPLPTSPRELFNPVGSDAWDAELDALVAAAAH